MDDDKKPNEEEEETTEIFITPVQIASESNDENVDELVKSNDSNASGHLYAAIDYLATIFGAANPFIKRIDDDIDNDRGGNNENQINEDDIDETEIHSPNDPTKLPKDSDIDADGDDEEEEADESAHGPPYNVISTPEKQNLHRIDEITNTKQMTQSYKQESVQKGKPEYENPWTFIKNDDELTMKEPIIKETLDQGDINAFVEHQIASEMLLQEPELPVVFDQSSIISGFAPPSPQIPTPSAEYSTNSNENPEDMESDPYGPYD